MFNALKSRRSELCPYCFEYFQLKDTPFRCSRCDLEPDAVLGKRWGDHRPMGRVMAPGGRFLTGLKCGDCGTESRSRICPECHSDLPATLSNCKNIIFAIIGAREAGKSHFIAVIIEQIKRRLGPSLHMLLEAMNDETMARYTKDFYEPLFRDHTKIHATRTAASDKKVQRPLLYSLTFTGKSFLGRDTIKGAVVLAFFDTAGEDLDQEDVMSTFNRYIYRSHGIVLLVDPLQFPQVQDRLRGKAPLPRMNTEAAEILTRTTRLVQKGLNLAPLDQIPIPLAVTFSKFDAVRPLLDEQSSLHGCARHEGGFDVQDFRAISSELEALLGAWGGQDLLNQVQKRYATHGFFGISALGCDPDASGGKVLRVSPKRVEDPFLWLLAENGLIAKVRT